MAWGEVQDAWYVASALEKEAAVGAHGAAGVTPAGGEIRVYQGRGKFEVRAGR